MRPFNFAYTWKTLFVHRLVTQRGRLYKIPACWSNGTVGKATIVVVTMKRLSSTALREKCTQFVFCPSLLAVTFPSLCPYILHLWPWPSCTILTKLLLALSSFGARYELCLKRLILGHETCSLPNHKWIQDMTMSVSPQMLASSFFLPPTPLPVVYFVTMLIQSATLWAHGGVKSHCARIWSNVSGVKVCNSSLEQAGKSENGLDYSVALWKRPKNAKLATVGCTLIVCGNLRWSLTELSKRRSLKTILKHFFPSADAYQNCSVHIGVDS